MILAVDVFHIHLSHFMSFTGTERSSILEPQEVIEFMCKTKLAKEY